MRLARRRRPSGVNGALACVMKTSGVDVSVVTHILPEVFAYVSKRSQRVGEIHLDHDWCEADALLKYSAIS